MAHRRRARRRRGALRRARPRDARAARRGRRGRAVADARAGSRSPPPPTRSARSPTCPASSPPPTAPARASSSTPCTPRRTAPIDVAALGCDALACSAYKWFGPHIGILWARPELLADLSPDKLRPSPDTVPDRWELGTLPFESLVGVRGGRRLRAARSTARSCAPTRTACWPQMVEGLGALAGVTVHGAARDRTRDGDVHRRRPSLARRRRRTWRAPRSPSGTATTTPWSSRAGWASSPTAPCAPASSPTTTATTSIACSRRSRSSRS